MPDEVITKCKELNSNKSVCVVESWTWWDIQQEVDSNLSQGPLCVIKSDRILYDELKRFPVGGWVRTSPLVESHFNCVFETRSTFYILIGSGTRKSVLANNALAFV